MDVTVKQDQPKTLIVFFGNHAAQWIPDKVPDVKKMFDVKKFFDVKELASLAMYRSHPIPQLPS